MAEDEDFPQGLQSKVIVIAAARDGWYDLANEASKKLKTAEADVALQLSLQEATPEEMDARTKEVAELQEQSTAKGAELSGLLSQNGEFVDKLRQIKAQNAARGTVSDDLKLLAGDCERPSRRAEVVHPCDDLSTTPSMAAFSALLAEQEDYKNCCESLVLENHCTPGLAAEAKELHKKLTEREKAASTLKYTLKVHEKRASAAHESAASLKMKRASANASHLRLSEMATRFGARTNLRAAQARLLVAEQKAKLAQEDLDKVREQFNGSAKVA